MLTARLLRAETGKDVHAYYHMAIDVSKVIFDLAHKGPPPGKRQWLDANELRLYVRSIMERALVNGQRPPHVIVRGHYHERRFAHVHEHLEGRVSGQPPFVEIAWLDAEHWGCWTEEHEVSERMATLRPTICRGYFVRDDAETVVICMSSEAPYLGCQSIPKGCIISFTC